MKFIRKCRKNLLKERPWSFENFLHITIRQTCVLRIVMCKDNVIFAEKDINKMNHILLQLR